LQSHPIQIVGHYPRQVAWELCKD